ncbi:sentrin-specific protease 2-like [Tachysurus ichikawai]
MHWTLAAIDFKSQTIQKYLTKEHRVKKGCILEDSRWTIVQMRTFAIPKQLNGNDCGVFVCKYADFLSQGKPFTFRQWAVEKYDDE